MQDALDAEGRWVYCHRPAEGVRFVTAQRQGTEQRLTDEELAAALNIYKINQEASVGDVAVALAQIDQVGKVHLG